MSTKPTTLGAAIYSAKFLSFNATHVPAINAANGTALQFAIISTHHTTLHSTNFSTDKHAVYATLFPSICSANWTAIFSS